jgi:hypothetical protein
MAFVDVERAGRGPWQGLIAPASNFQEISSARYYCRGCLEYVMRFFGRLVLILAMTVASIGAVKSQDGVRPKSGSIAGRVILANKGITGVTVTVTMSGDALSGKGLTMKVRTDDEGRFQISNLSAGSYYVWPFVPALVVAEATGIHPDGKIVALAEGETVEDVDFHLSRGAAITGRVSDSAGRPVIDERVRLIPIGDDVRRLASSIYPGITDIRTDDRGVYRVFGLPGGKYKVAIGDQFAAFNSVRGRRFYPQTFHPDVPDESKAEVIEVPDGGEATNVDITVARSLTGFSASGHFIDGENGRPVANIKYGMTIIVGSRPSGFMSGNGVSTTDGGFRVDNLPPGRYSVTILPSGGSGYYGETAAFDIIDSDVSDLETKIHRASTISGYVVIEGAPDKSILARLARVRVETTIFTQGSSIGTVNYTDFNPDGTFQVGPLQAGTARIRVSSPDRNTAAEFALLSIDVNGVDKSRGIEIGTGENISGVRLVLGYGTGTIRGSMRVEGGVLPSGTYVYVALARQGSGVTVADTRMDARGHFVFERVPPGNYEIVVTAYLENRRVTARQPVFVGDGSISESTITLNLGEGATPKP